MLCNYGHARQWAPVKSARVCMCVCLVWDGVTGVTIRAMGSPGNSRVWLMGSSPVEID